MLWNHCLIIVYRNDPLKENIQKDGPILGDIYNLSHWIIISISSIQWTQINYEKHYTRSPEVRNVWFVLCNNLDLVGQWWVS